MTISATLTPEDYVNAQRVQLRVLLLRNTVVVGMVFVLVPALSIYCIWQLISPPPDGINWMPFAIVGMASLLPFFYWVLLPRQMRKAFAVQEWLREPKEFRIDATRIIIRSGGKTYTRPWSDFRKYESHADMIFLYESERNYHIFPRNWFSAEEYASFKEILEKNLGPAANAKR